MTAQDLDDGLVGLRTLVEEKPKKDVAIRDFAFNKFPSDKTAMERLIADIYSAFWNGEFAPDGLTLRQDQSDPGPESFYRLTRSHLARAALGSRKYAEMGEARALEFLALFNFSDYRKMADLPHGYRYYFCPEDDAAGHKRGLCATEAELEGWYAANMRHKFRRRELPIDSQFDDGFMNDSTDLSRAPDLANALAAIKDLWKDGQVPPERINTKVSKISAWCKGHGLKAPGKRTIQSAFQALMNARSQDTN